MKYKHQIKAPILQWDEDGHPVSTDYGDIYYSVHNGLNETDHVFIHGNNLLDRFQNIHADERFTIFECGFGTGLNFLRTCWYWEKLNVRAKLHFVSLEAQPLTRGQLKQALGNWQQDLGSYIEPLIKVYKDLKPGVNELTITEHITLTLILADAKDLKIELLEELTIDAIFMDGFAPSRNPDMWQASLCELLYELSKPGSTLATYSVAGMVKRNLSNAGFIIQKKPGYGKKRDMLVAYKAAS